MLKIDISHDLERLIRDVDDLHRKHIPYATALALTRTAQAAKKAVEDELPRAFDRPTRWTMNSVFFKSAKKTRLEAKVWIKDETGKGIPATKYLGPQIFGGARHFKRFEKALQRVGILPPGMMAVPAAAAELDAYGNMSRGQIVKILSFFSAFSEVGYRANITDKRRKSMWKGSEKRGVRGFEYFALSKQTGKLPPGIYLRKNYSVGELDKVAHLQKGAAKPVLLFVRAATYRKRLRFFEIAEATAQAKLPRHFGEALAHAIATAK